MGNGGVFAAGRRRVTVPVPLVAQGIVFALGIWAVSYQAGSRARDHALRPETIRPVKPP